MNNQYEIKQNEEGTRYKVFKRKINKWLFKECGYIKWSKWEKIGKFETENKAVEFIKWCIHREGCQVGRKDIK
jgi:hypothetical protein